MHCMYRSKPKTHTTAMNRLLSYWQPCDKIIQPPALASANYRCCLLEQAWCCISPRLINSLMIPRVPMSWHPWFSCQRY